MKIGDIYLVNFHYEENYSFSKVRPAICILVNSQGNEFAALKVTSKERPYEKYSIPLKNENLKVKSYARCNKVEFFDKQKNIANIGTLSKEDLNAVISSFNEYCDEIKSISQSLLNSSEQSQVTEQDDEIDPEMR